MSGPTAPIAEAIAAYHAASMAVWNDERVWREEQASTESRLMAWPRPCEGTQLNRLLSVLFNGDVDLVLCLLRERDDMASPAWPPDAHDPKMQVLLRVVQRSMVAGHAAVQAGFGGLELSHRRAYMTATMEALADMAVRSGLPRAEAFEAVGIAKRRGFRAARRATTKKATIRK